MNTVFQMFLTPSRLAGWPTGWESPEPWLQEAPEPARRLSRRSTFSSFLHGLRGPQLKKKKQTLITRVGTAAPARSPIGEMPPVK